jgi:hypothetical protein
MSGDDDVAPFEPLDSFLYACLSRIDKGKIKIKIEIHFFRNFYN